MPRAETIQHALVTLSPASPELAGKLLANKLAAVKSNGHDAGRGRPAKMCYGRGFSVAAIAAKRRNKSNPGSSAGHCSGSAGDGCGGRALDAAGRCRDALIAERAPQATAKARHIDLEAAILPPCGSGHWGRGGWRGSPARGGSKA